MARTMTTRRKKASNPAELLREHAAEKAKLMLTRWPEEMFVFGCGPENWHGRFLERLARDGEAFNGYEPAANDPVTRAWKGRHRPKPKVCFKNAFLFGLDYPDEVTYYEGLCAVDIGGSPFSFDHAWVVHRGKVFDFTAEAAERESGGESFVRHYLGLPIPLKFVAGEVADSEMAGAVGPLFFGRDGGKTKSKRRVKVG